MRLKLLSDKELFFISGGGEPVKPITQPRDRFDEEEQAQSNVLSEAEEALNWREWLKKWLGKDK